MGNLSNWTICVNYDFSGDGEWSEAWGCCRFAIESARFVGSSSKSYRSNEMRKTSASEFFDAGLLGPSFISVKFDVQPGAIAKAGLFADFAQPVGACLERGGGGAFGHEQDVGGDDAAKLF